MGHAKISRLVQDDNRFLEFIKISPQNLELRNAYENWLEQRGDIRAEFLRTSREMTRLDPDHTLWSKLEDRLSELRLGIDRSWCMLFEPEQSDPRRTIEIGGVRLDKMSLYTIDTRPPDELRRDKQDTRCAAWKRLLDLIDEAAADGRSTLELPLTFKDDGWHTIKTLPPSIAKLTSVERMHLYGSALVRIPPEIGEMKSLRRLDVYQSYQLHWFPYEITHCPNLVDTRVSTRALHRPPFPNLLPPRLPEHAPAVLRKCSVCSQPFEDRGVHRVLIRRLVGPDVLPLLVNACSESCIASLPALPPHEFLCAARSRALEVRRTDRSPYDATLVDRVRRALRDRLGLSEKTYSSGIVFLLYGKEICGVLDNELMVSLDPERYQELRSRAHVYRSNARGNFGGHRLYVTPRAMQTDEAFEEWIEATLPR